jgi:hypothetical protein
MREPLYGNNSELIGYIKESGDVIEVFDKNSVLKGRVTSEGTFDRNHRLVARSRIPGLLLKD